MSGRCGRPARGRLSDIRRHSLYVPFVLGRVGISVPVLSWAAPGSPVWPPFRVRRAYSTARPGDVIRQDYPSAHGRWLARPHALAAAWSVAVAGVRDDDRGRRRDRRTRSRRPATSRVVRGRRARRPGTEPARGAAAVAPARRGCCAGSGPTCRASSRATTAARGWCSPSRPRCSRRGLAHHASIVASENALRDAIARAQAWIGDSRPGGVPPQRRAARHATRSSPGASTARACRAPTEAAATA